MSLTSGKYLWYSSTSQYLEPLLSVKGFAAPSLSSPSKINSSTQRCGVIRLRIDSASLIQRFPYYTSKNIR
jgi:hypothetical protein